jgi:hypothetical protein
LAITEVNTFPNPCTNAFTLQWNSNESEWITIDVMDATGRGVFTSRIASMKGLQQLNIPVENAHGLLLLRMSNSKGVLTKRLLSID